MKTQIKKKLPDLVILPLPSFDSNHLCHHLLQALLLWGSPGREPDYHAGDDHHLHQQDGGLAPHIWHQNDRHLACPLPNGSIRWGCTSYRYGVPKGRTLIWWDGQGKDCLGIIFWQETGQEGNWQRHPKLDPQHIELQSTFIEKLRLVEKLQQKKETMKVKSWLMIFQRGLRCRLSCLEAILYTLWWLLCSTMMAFEAFHNLVGVMSRVICSNLWLRQYFFWNR